jgi:hypothetical protein
LGTLPGSPENKDLRRPPDPEIQTGFWNRGDEGLSGMVAGLTSDQQRFQDEQNGFVKPFNEMTGGEAMG